MTIKLLYWLLGSSTMASMFPLSAGHLPNHDLGADGPSKTATKWQVTNRCPHCLREEWTVGLMLSKCSKCQRVCGWTD
jgi:hypothetical protein